MSDLTLLQRLATHSRTRAARNAGEDELALYFEIERNLMRLNEALTERDQYRRQVEQVQGLQRDLEIELFGAVQPMQPDGGAEVTARAVAVVKALKAVRRE